MSYDIFIEQLDEAEKAYPSLKRQVSDEKFVLAGSLDIIDANGKLWDSYKVEICYEEGFPYRFPSLYETGNKIPKIADWHIYEDTLACCVKVKPAEIIRCVNGITLTDYIKGEALPYLFNQTHRRITGYYVNGEYSHGYAGILQFYSEELKTGNDIRKTIRLMEFIASNPRPIRTSNCFCGSKIKFRKCHKDAFDKIKNIGDKLILDDANTIRRILATHH